MDTVYQNPISHALDPASSAEAAREVTESGRRDTHCAMVLDAVRANPGLTSAELAKLRIGDLDMTEVRRRLCDLKAAGFIERGEARKCGVSGKKAVVWEVTRPRMASKEREIRTFQADLFG